MAAPSVNQDPLEEKINYTPNESKQLLIKLKTILEQLLESDVMGKFSNKYFNE